MPSKKGSTLQFKNLPKTPPPNTVTFGVRSSAYEFGGGGGGIHTHGEASVDYLEVLFQKEES